MTPPLSRNKGLSAHSRDVPPPHPNPFARIKGVHVPVSEALSNGMRRGLPVEDRRSPTEGEDATLIDLTLTRGTAKAGQKIPPPETGVTYAGLTPDQRAWFWAWLADPKTPTDLAYQKLYVAYLEVALFDSVTGAEAARREIHALLQTPVWWNHSGLIRAWLLALWLAQDGPALAEWLGAHPLEPDLLADALSLQAQMGTPLQPSQAALAVASVMGAGGTPSRTPAGDADAAPPTDLAVMKHRLGSLAADLGGEILAHALAQVDEAERAPRPWRCSHRELRIALPQPPVMAPLRPLLRELTAHPLSVDPPGANLPGTLDDEDLSDLDGDDDSATNNSAANEDWNLILQFESSRSQYFDYVLAQAQKEPGFTQIMDENRRMIYRIRFARRHMKRFWRIWEYVQGWSATQVYLNGQELESWKIWPYSQYLR